MNILVLGSGGREHAFCWKLAQSPRTAKLYAAPGNAGTAALAENVDLDLGDFDAIADFALQKDVGLVVCGPEQPLADGLADRFAEDEQLSGVKFFGPSKAAAQLESSKDFAKQFMLRHGVPTAESRTFTAEELENGLQFLQIVPPPYVLKADGLASGKGVLVTDDSAQAQKLFREMLEGGKFGEAGAKVLVEQFLDGLELSVFVFTDGEDYLILPAAKDYKRSEEGDKGLNTGGMGAVSPVPFADPGFISKVETKVVRPTLKGLKEEGVEYKGALFIGLMNVGDEPFVIEYNCRMGDPETQAVFPRIESDMVDLMEACADGGLGKLRVKVSGQAAATVVLVSGGYPEAYEKGKAIEGLDKEYEGVTVFHAGTASEGGKTLTAGGRVLALTGKGATAEEALSKAYAAAEAIDFEGRRYRTDVGEDLKPKPEPEPEPEAAPAEGQAPAPKSAAPESEDEDADA